MRIPWRDEAAKERWTQDAVAVADEGFELCDECSGQKLCSEAPHPYCRGWCHICGGAGQWPLDPKMGWWAPSVPLIDVEVRARQRRDS